MEKGSGAGSEITAMGESLQAYACAARQYYGRDLTNAAEITEDSVKGYAFCDRKLDVCLKKLKANWLHSVVVTANLIMKELPKGSSKYRFYRGVGLPDLIYSKFHEHKDESGLRGSDKWNPADIWMAKDSFNYNDNNISSLSDLNRYLYDNFMNGNMYGISLKIVPKGLPHSKVYNDGKPLVADFKNIRVGKNMIDSKDVYIEYTSEGKKGEIQLRNFSSRAEPSSWQAEIKGNTAAGGKIGGGILFEYAIESGVSSSKLMKPSNFKSQIDNPSDATIKKFAKMFKELSGSTEDLKTLERTAMVLAKQNKTWWMSKYLSVDFAYTIYKEKKINEVTKKAFEYGSSATKNSSIFIKYYQ